MAQQYSYSTYSLPCPRTSNSRPADFPTLAQRYATLRLEALLTSPKAFGSTHAIESVLTEEQWGARIWQNDAVILVCVARPISQDAIPGDPDSALLAGAWVASAVLRGPLSASEYALPHEEDSPAHRDDVETKWQMTAVFVSAAHRGRGLGKMLIQAGKDYALAQTAADAKFSRSTRARLRVLIHPDNLVVLSLYSTTGFVDAGRTTGKEAYRTNGDMALWELKLGSLTEEEKVVWTTARVAVVMEWLGETRN